MADDAGANFVAEQALQQVFIEGKRVLRKDRIAELLELVHDLVVEAGIMMIGTAEHDDTDAVLTLELVENLAGATADACFVFLKRLESGFACTLVLFVGQTEDGLPRLQHLVSE